MRHDLEAVPPAGPAAEGRLLVPVLADAQDGPADVLARADVVEVLVQPLPDGLGVGNRPLGVFPVGVVQDQEAGSVYSTNLKLYLFRLKNHLQVKGRRKLKRYKYLL